jgi:very-short-patch-repair endonuclease
MVAALFDLSKITVYKKKKKKSPLYKSRIQKRADKLNKYLPKSEQWFQAKWNNDIVQHKYTKFKDEFNSPISKYIPDVINRGFKYIIEVDGSIHDKPEQILRDQVKDTYYKMKGFKVFRVKAYDETSYAVALEGIKSIRLASNS